MIARMEAPPTPTQDPADGNGPVHAKRKMFSTLGMELQTKPQKARASVLPFLGLHRGARPWRAPGPTAQARPKPPDRPRTNTT